MYAVGFVAAAQVIGVDIAPLVAVGEHSLMLRPVHGTRARQSFCSLCAAAAAGLDGRVMFRRLLGT